MATNDSPQGSARRSRKEYLLTRKQQEQYQQIRLAVIAIVGLLAIIMIGGAIFEYVSKPGQPVASVNATEISLGDWEDRVQLERGRTIAGIADLYDAVGGNVSQLTQFAGGQLQSVLFPEVLGEQVLFQMIDEELIAQEADSRGISVSDAEIDAFIEEQFNFFDGGLPAPEPTSTASPVPTPSLTPIPQGDEEPVEEDAVEAEPTTVPEPTPEPTAVSAEAFQEQYDEAVGRFSDAGGSESDYRSSVRNQLLRERLRDELAEESELQTEEEQVNLFYISFTSEDDANATLTEINAGKEFTTAWNEIRSAERVTQTQPFASELPWTSLAGISTTFGTDAFDAVQTYEIGVPSDVISANNERFILFQLRDRGMRELSESALNQRRAEVLTEWLDDKRIDAIVFEDTWSENVPTRPLLDPKYYQVDQPAAGTEGG